MNMSETSEIDTIYGKEKLRVTCVERKYKVVGSRVSYLISAKKELDEDVTEKLLHEDMELKTFLTHYEITNIMLPVLNSKTVTGAAGLSIGSKHTDTIKNNVPQTRTVRSSVARRRGLFDFLNLPEEFAISDYKKALEENEIKITNTAMPYDDMRWFEKKGKVIKLTEKRDNKTIYKILKKGEANEIRSEMEVDRTIKSLKEGQKVLIGTFKD